MNLFQLDAINNALDVWRRRSGAPIIDTTVVIYVNSDAHPPLSVLATHAMFQNMRPQGNDSDALMIVRAFLHVRNQKNAPEHTHSEDILWCPNVFAFFADLRTSGCSSCCKKKTCVPDTHHIMRLCIT